MNDLEKLRAEINSIDADMAKLFAERMKLTEGIAAYKMRSGLPVLDRKQEARILEKNAGLIDDEVIREYYVPFQRSVMDCSKAYQERMMHDMKVAFCGAEGDFAHSAVRRLFPTASLMPCPSFESAYNACSDALADAAVLPLENSAAGDVGTVMDIAFSGDLYINKMIDLPVRGDNPSGSGEKPSASDATRFAVFTRSQKIPERKGKIDEHFILVFTVLNEAGALAKTLNIIGAHGFNMCNLHSRPMKELMWNYYFFVELEGNVNTPDGEDLLRQLGTVCDKLKLLGTYSRDSYTA